VLVPVLGDARPVELGDSRLLPSVGAADVLLARGHHLIQGQVVNQLNHPSFSGKLLSHLGRDSGSIRTQFLTIQLTGWDPLTGGAEIANGGEVHLKHNQEQDEWQAKVTVKGGGVTARAGFINDYKALTPDEAATVSTVLDAVISNGPRMNWRTDDAYAVELAQPEVVQPTSCFGLFCTH